MKRMLLIVAIGVLATGCGNDGGVGGAERQLDEAYLEPLAAAGLEFEVVEACHLGEPEDDKWQLTTIIRIASDSTTVKDALTEAVDVIRDDRNPIVVQQLVGEPGRGWDGVLEATAPDVSTLGLTRNNVEVDGENPPVGWAPTCDL